jgi:hypothetical protein
MFDDEPLGPNIPSAEVLRDYIYIYIALDLNLFFRKNLKLKWNERTGKCNGNAQR